MSLVVVLAVISLSLAISYTVLRTQTTALHVVRNSDRQAAARQAAYSGMTAALRRMHLADVWQGVGHALSGWVGGGERYSVTFTTGDAALTPEHPEYGDYPFRVTLLATGYANDPANPKATATYQIRAVVRLVPRQLASEPSGWEHVASHTIHQWHAGSKAKHSRFSVELPVRIEGSVRLQKELELCEEYPEDDDAREQYLGDLNAMRLAKLDDHRPFAGAVHLPFLENLGSVFSLLSGQLGLPVHDAPSSDDVDWEHPGFVHNYQLYPGGIYYQVPVLPSALSNVRYEPDPLVNPLGAFLCHGEVHLYDDVKIHGTLITAESDGVHVRGSNVELQPVDLPAVDDDARPVQLPVALVGGDLSIHEDSQGSIQGLIAVWDELEFKSAPQASIDFTLEGRVFTKEFLVRGRTEWDRDDDWWRDRHGEFLVQRLQPGGQPYFPVWLKQSLQYVPRIRIKPPADDVTYHWLRGNQPIYVPHPDDEGLRWDLLEWTENP